MMASHEHGVWLVDRRRSATRAWCRARLRPCSVWKSAPEDWLAALVAAVRDKRMLRCCSKIASTSSTRWPACGGASRRSASVSILATSEKRSG